MKFALTVSRNPGGELGTRVMDAVVGSAVFVIVALVCILISMLVERFLKRFS